MEWSDKTWNDKIKSSQFSYKTDTSRSFLSFSVIFTSVNNRRTTDTLAAPFLVKILQDRNVGADPDSNLRFWKLKIIFTEANT